MFSGEKLLMAKSKCLFCGNNPVPHTIFWINESLNILLTPLRQKLLFNPVSRFAAKKAWNIQVSKFFLTLAEGLKIISRRSDKNLCKVPRAKVLWDEARRRGIVMEELLFFGRPFDCYVASNKKFPISNFQFPKKYEIKNSKTKKIKNSKTKKIIFSGLPRPDNYSNPWLDLMDDKWLFKKVMMENGLPVPRGSSCSSFAQAKEIFTNLKKSEILNSKSETNYKLQITNYKPMIVKPRSGSRGRHTTTFVYNQADLVKAFKIAKQLCHWVIVEEQLFGPVYRATVVNFELCGVLRGDPPQVVGDGEHTIKELIEIKNQQPHPGVKDIVADQAVESFLARQNLKLSSLTAASQVINLSEKIGVNYGGSSSEDFEICHPDNRELFIQAAKVLGDPLLGFDFIIPDISRSWKEQKCGFIEVNSLPFINLHHDPLHGTSRNVAGKIWDMIKL